MTRRMLLAVLLLAGLGTLAVAPVAGADPTERAGEGAAIVLRPGTVTVRMPGAGPVTVSAPVRLDLWTLTTLVDDAELIERQAGGVAVVHVPIEQRPGSRLAIGGSGLREVEFTGRGRLVGTDAILSINDVAITASGDRSNEADQPQALIGYEAGSGVRISRVQITDTRSGSGAGRVIDLGDSEFRIVSAQISGGAGGIRLDGVRPAELTGVQIAGSRGPGLVAGGRTALNLRDVTVARNTGGGLLLSGRALTFSTRGPVTLARNGTDLGLVHTRPLDLRDVHTASPAPTAQRSVAPEPANLPLFWPLAGLAVLGAAAVWLEVVRNRHNRARGVIPLYAPEYVLNR